jgi:K+-sensing histidine kinase KdpD
MSLTGRGAEPSDAKSVVAPAGRLEVGRDRWALLGALLAPLAVSAILSLFRDHIANTDAALVLVLVVVAVASNGFRVAGVLAALSAGVWFDFFMTRPFDRFAITSSTDVETTLLLLAVGVAVTELAVWGRRKHAQAGRDAGYLLGIQAAAEVASVGGSPTALIETVAGELTKMLGLRRCSFEYGTAGLGQPARLRHDGRVEWKHKVWDVEQHGLPVDSDIELIVESGGRLEGRFLMRAAADMHPTRSQRLVAVTLAGQVGAALR